MAGHSKWHNIRLRKGKQDAERSKKFTKLAKEIIVAAKTGGGNPDSNMRLRAAIDAARKESMPQDNIKRNIQRGSDTDGANYDELTYEGYGPGGMAVLVQCLTDNKNRTVGDVRSIFTKNSGRLAESGSVSYRFTPKGIILIDPGVTTEDKLMDVALEAGAEDIQPAGDGGFEVTTDFQDFGVVRDALEAAGIATSSAETTMIPDMEVELTGKDAELALRLLDQLDDNDDVQNVYSNLSLSDEDMENL